MLWFWLFVLLAILLVAMLPTWPYARRRSWGYAPSAFVLALLVLLLALFLLGVVIIPWPWYAAY